MAWRDRAALVKPRSERCLIGVLFGALLCMVGGAQQARAVDILTHHYDGQRTGWNSQEQVLSPSSVQSGSFGLLVTVALDDHVDAQPLVLSDQPISGADGNRTVVYVATNSNTIYAIDAATGAILLTTNLGSPVPMSAVGGCNNNGANLGIGSTPVIDRAAGLLYVIAYTFDGQSPSYTLHALDLSTLADALPPVVVTASQTLDDGSIYVFDPSASRLRSALLEANGKIYATFASFCDFFSDRSRGWVLGWDAGSLQPLPAMRLNDQHAASANNFFLSSVWMSGSGPAVAGDGSLFFVTGNSDPTPSYDSVINLSESLVRITGDLSAVADFFTPFEVNELDNGDLDFGAGGVLLLPTQPGATTDFAVAAGKSGKMYLIDQQNLGTITPGGPDNVLGTFDIGGACWCAPSYFLGADGVARVASSGGSSVVVWQLTLSPSVTLSPESTSAALTTGQDPGFFTSVSSNGTQDGTALIWAVSRPANASGSVTLYAFDARDSSLAFSAPAGTWQSQGNANIVPVVVNGQVFVATTQQLAIFGVGAAPPAATASLAMTPTTRAVSTDAAPMWSAPMATSEHRISGTITWTNGTLLTVTTRSGRMVNIDRTEAQDARQSVALIVGEAITATGIYDARGTLQARLLLRAKASPALWQPDQ